jgi:UDP-glucose 4-epimerase
MEGDYRMKIFLTGGTGFIGSYVVHELSKRGHEVTILARNPDKVPCLSDLPGVKIVPGLLTDFDVIEQNLEGKDACIHIALGWGDHATSMLKNDTFPSVFLFETAARLGVGHLIYTSSTAALGHLFKNAGERDKPEPTDFYGATKASSECFLLAVSHTYPMRCNIIRPGYTFGNPVVRGAFTEPDNRFRSIVKQAKTGDDINIISNDGTQFIWAGDLARVYASVLESGSNRKTYFALGDAFYSWESIAQKTIELTGSNSRIITEDKGCHSNPFCYDVSLIKQEFGLNFKSWEKIVEHVSYLLNAEA